MSPSFRSTALMLALSSMGALQAAAQTTITGRVTTEVGGAPIAGATVSITSLSLGAQTDANGRYTFTVPAARSTLAPVSLTARRIGYAPKTFQITLGNGSVSHDFALVGTATELEGVVVTALGIQQEKSQLGTAVQQVSSAELNSTPTTSIMDALQGKVAGVQITGAGTQGGSSNILIRGANSINGNNDPLFIVDGIAGVERGPRRQPGRRARRLWQRDLGHQSRRHRVGLGAEGTERGGAVWLARVERRDPPHDEERARHERADQHRGSASQHVGEPVGAADVSEQLWPGRRRRVPLRRRPGRGRAGRQRPELRSRVSTAARGCTFIKNTQTYDALPCMQFTGRGHGSRIRTT